MKFRVISAIVLFVVLAFLAFVEMSGSNQPTQTPAGDSGGIVIH